MKNESWRTPSPGNLNIGFQIKDGRLRLEDPIVMNIQPAKLEITGDMGLDTTLNYRIASVMPASVIGSGATSLLNSLPGGSSVKEIKITGLIGGTAKKPDVSLSVADTARAITEAVKEQVVETVSQKVEEVKTQVNEEINRQIDQLMAEAQKQADNIRNGAKQAADRLRSEANSAADKLESEAARKSVIERGLAKVAADKLRSEGEASAKKLEQEGENQARAALAAAQKKADELKRN